MAASHEAQANFEALAENEYTGRGMVMGRTAMGDLMQVYWVTGRSDPSRNRIMVVEGSGARTDVFDRTKVDPEKLDLLIYNAMISTGKHHVVSNGEHTDDIVRGLSYGETFEEVLQDWKHEEDTMRTPRISGSVYADEQMRYKFSVISKDPEQKLLDDPKLEKSQRRNYTGTMHNFSGEGLSIHTYEHDAPEGEMVPSFDRSPYPLPLGENIDETLGMYWEVLDNPNRVAVVVKTIDPKTGKIALGHHNQLGE